MKHFCKKLIAVTAAVMTMASASLTANAYYLGRVDSPHPINALDNDYTTYGGSGYVWNTLIAQQGLPVFDRQYLLHKEGVGAVAIRSGRYGQSTHMFATLDWSIADIEALSRTKMYVDRLRAQNNQGDKFGLQLEYEPYSNEDLNQFGLRLMGWYHAKTTLSNFKLTNYQYNASTGYYSGDLCLDGYYFAGLKVSCSDGITEFEKPVLVKNSTGDDFITKVHFSGWVTLPETGSLLFSNSSTRTCNILTDVKFRYTNDDPNNLCVLTKFKKSYSRTYSTNSVFTGLLDGNTLHTTISGSMKTNFQNKNFLAAKSSGTTLYICAGSNLSIPNPDWNNYGENKLKALLSCGYKDAFKHNTWVMGNIDGYSQIVFCSGATTTSRGSSYYTCTPAKFRQLLNQ